MTAPTALPPLPAAAPPPAAQPATSPRIGLVLGAGGARGLAHVHALEALDELGLKPAAIAGTSMGAIIGAGAAAGLDGRQVREVIVTAFRNQGEVWARLWQLRPKSFGALFGGGLVQFDAERTLEVFLPPAIPADFSHLAVPFAVISADFYGCSEVVIGDGPLRRAIAASIAIPLVFRPVEVDGVCLVDGGIINPLPYDRVPAPVDLTVAVDVIGGPVRQPGRATPSAMESLFGASQIMMQSVLAEKLKTRRPDVLIRPNVDMFRVLDFMKANAILRATQGLKDDVKRAVEAALEAKARSPARGEEAAQ